MTPDNIKAIAEGLTAAQRSNLLLYAEDHWWCADGRVANGMFRKHLIERPRYSGRADFTPLGLAVRAYLQQETQP